MKATVDQGNTASPETRANRRLKEFIAAQPFLHGLSPNHLETLADCAMVQEFSAGEHIFHEGDMANRFYLVLQGKVALESCELDEDPLPIQTIGAGEVFGWSWMFPPYYWHFDARAVEPTRAVFFYGTRLRDHCEQDPALGYELMKRMAEVVIKRLQATRKQLLEARHHQR